MQKSIPHGCAYIFHWRGEAQAEPMEEQSGIWPVYPSLSGSFALWVASTTQMATPVFHGLAWATPLCREGLYPKFLYRQTPV